MMKPEGVKCLPACIVAAGNRNHNNGSVNNAGSNGNYWSSTVNGDNARNLNFNSNNANTNNNNRANGFSARCFRGLPGSPPGVLPGGFFFREPFINKKMNQRIFFTVTAARLFFTVLALICFMFAMPGPVSAQLVINSRNAVDIEMRGYDSLAEKHIFKGKLSADDQQNIKTAYRGLALLVFSQGQTYPLIIDEKPLSVQISSPAEPPAFPSSPENKSLYRALKDKTSVPLQYSFALLMVQARELLDSSHSIRTVAELQAKKKEFHEFVRDNFSSLKQSDMIRRIIAQSFMMNEYVDYHVEGRPATDIKKRYQQEVVADVAGWLTLLSPHIDDHEIINYCVSLYYNRSMITLASLIIDRYKDVAYCPGETAETPGIPNDLQIVRAGEEKAEKLEDVKGNILIAFVSDQCPVSLVATVSKARELAESKQPMNLLVAPMETLSGKHLAMNKMIRNGKLLFVRDEKWRKDNLARKIKLPLFVQAKN